MYNIYNKSNIFYLYDFFKNKTYFIGNKLDLLKILAKAFKIFDYNDSETWFNEYLDDINMGKDFSNYRKISLSTDNNGNSFFLEKIIIENKRYLFFDGFDRIIDIRIYKDDAIKCLKNDKIEYKYIPKYKKRQYRKIHSGNCKNHKGTNCLRQLKKLNSMFEFDEELKSFHFKKLGDSFISYPWYDDRIRRVESNWKSQYKTNKQYHIHKNVRNSKTIRKNLIDDFSFEEIEDMLYEDFNKKI